MKKYKILSTLALAAVMLACSDNNKEIASAGYEYFPLEEGNYVIYQVEKTQYSVADDPIQVSYYLKELCSKPYIDGAGNEIYKIERYKKTSLQQNWKIDSVWTAYRPLDKAVKVENNIAFVKMVFPVSNGNKWNGNLLNTLSAENYKASTNTNSLKINNLIFDKSLTVTQKYDSSLVSLDKRQEIYAPNIGLVYKETSNLEYCQSSQDCIGKGIIDSGQKLVMKIVSYGKE